MFVNKLCWWGCRKKGFFLYLVIEVKIVIGIEDKLLLIIKILIKRFFILVFLFLGIKVNICYILVKLCWFKSINRSIVLN